MRTTVNDPVSPASVRRVSAGSSFTDRASEDGKSRNDSSWFCTAVALTLPAATVAAPRSVSMWVTDLARAIGSFNPIENGFGVPVRFQTRAMTPSPIPSSAGFSDQSRTFGSEIVRYE